jgi:hypothetical protein
MGRASSLACRFLCAVALVGAQAHQTAAAAPSVAAVSHLVQAAEPLVLSALAAAPAASATAAASVGSHVLQASTQASIPDDACTFRVYEVQACNATVGLLRPRIAIFLRVDKVYGPDGRVAVDVAVARPREAGNSYQKLEGDGEFEIARLEDGRVLRVGLEGALGGLKFEVGEVEWRVGDAVVEEGRAWCEVGQWMGGEEWSCDGARDGKDRVSQLGSTTGKLNFTDDV